MKKCNICQKDSPIEALFCIECGTKYNAATGKTINLTTNEEEEVYYIHHAELTDLLKKWETFIFHDHDKYIIRYMGRTVKFMD